jgi:peptidoglycan/xylan/chitin deacetylase (PgdA/CDA1 family)
MMSEGARRWGADIAAGIAFPDLYASLRNALTKTQLIIMNYHRVTAERHDAPIETTSPEAFERHIQYFRRNYELLSLDQVLQCVYGQRPFPERGLAMTIDDGYKDSYRCAYPLLRKYSVPCTIFLTTGHVGTDTLFWWDKVEYAVRHAATSRLDLGELGEHRLRSPPDMRRVVSSICKKLKNAPEDKKNLLVEKLLDLCQTEIPDGLGSDILLSWEEVKEMAEGGIEFGAHSVTHPILTNMSGEKTKHEIRKSKEDIEKRLGVRVNSFAYPDGNFSSEIVRMVDEAGFRGAVTIQANWVGPRSNPYLLGRIGTTEDLNQLKLMLCGFWGDLHRVF